MVSTAGISQQIDDSPSTQATASPIKALRSIVQHRISGRLTIRQITNEPTVWQLHTGKGKIHYVTSALGDLERTTYLLHRMESPFLDLRSLYGKQPTYQALYQAWQDKVITLQHMRSVLVCMCQEALVHITAQSQVELQFERTVGLDPILLSLPLQDMGNTVVTPLKKWQKLKPHITSPFQRLQVASASKLTAIAQQVDAARGARAQQTLLPALDSQPCLYELAHQLDMDVLQLATMLLPLIQHDLVTLHPFQNAIRANPATIVCIDDSSTVQRKVKLILEMEGYRVISLTDPLRALSLLVRERPKLVLLDITMPDLDGYELCRMLRQSSALKHLPIVMLTGRDGLIDRVRAKIVGASDYMTKPFNSSTLTQMVSKHISLENTYER